MFLQLTQGQGFPDFEKAKFPQRRNSHYVARSAESMLFLKVSAGQP